MSTTSQLTDFSDLYTALIEATRTDSTVTATLNQAKRYINIGLQDMHLGWDYKFPWAERSATLITQPTYTTGTVSLSQGSQSLTGSGTAWDTANSIGFNNFRVGGKIKIAGVTDLFTITAIASDTAATVDHILLEGDVSDATYMYFEDEYALASDFLRPVDQHNFSDSMPIDLLDRLTFRRRYIRNFITGRPTVATILDKPFDGNTTPVRKIQLHKPPNTAMAIPYEYITDQLVVQADGTPAVSLSNDTDEPILPFRYRHAILFWALIHWYRDKRNDSRTQAAKNEYREIMLRTVSDVDVGSRRVRLRPNLRAYRAKARTPYSGRGQGRYSTNNSFDRFE